MRSKATENMVKLINDLCGCDAVSVEDDYITVRDGYDDGAVEHRYAILCDNDDDVYNTLMAMHDGMTLLNSIRGQDKPTKRAAEIKEEIARIDKAIDSRITDYKNGIITEEILNADKIRFTSARNTLLWVLK